MVKIVIENLAQKEVAAIGLGTSVLKLVQANYIDWMHACGGKGRCTTCKFEIVEGGDQLGPITAAELATEKGELGEKVKGLAAKRTHWVNVEFEFQM
ncbi:MAG: (2Fe-2S)-binding protein [Flammeovirgaceae bacterium]|nr:(2Fe-2S)-binding protein [Flammeovirgaceae bacterium]